MSLGGMTCAEILRKFGPSVGNLVMVGVSSQQMLSNIMTHLRRWTAAR
jgi:hypothetical protein